MATHPLCGTRPRAAVFDCDGLLVDTEPCWTIAETELFARRGLGFGDEQKALLIGRTLPAACARLADLFDEPGRGPDLQRELFALVTDAVAGHAEPMPGAHEIVDAAAARVPVAVASNSPRALLDLALRRGRFTGRFPVVLSADDVTDAKPAPEMYRTAAERLAVAPGACVAFEDSNTGTRAARAAGVPCVGVPSLAGAGLDADVVVGSLADPALLDWVRTW